MLDAAIDHTKMKRLGRILNIPQPYAVGIMEMLWRYTKEQYPAGNIGKADDIDIEEACGWPVELSGKLVPALIAAKWLDESGEHRLIVHDWSYHAIGYVHAKLARMRQCFADGKPPQPKRGDLNSYERKPIREWLRSLGHDPWNDDDDSTPKPRKPQADSMEDEAKPTVEMKRKEMRGDERKGNESNRNENTKPATRSPAPVPIRTTDSKSKSIRPPSARESPTLAALAQGRPSPDVVEAMRSALHWFGEGSMPEPDEGVVLELASAAQGLRLTEIRPALREFLEAETAWKRNRRWHPDSWGFFLSKWKPWLAKRPRDMPMGDDERAAVTWARTQEVQA
jgi:hypothetical protein